MTDLKFSRQFRNYLSAPIWLMLILVGTNIGIYMIHRRSAIIMTIALMIYLVLQIVLNIVRRNMIVDEMLSFAAQYGQIQRRLLAGFSLPYALTDYKGKLLWINNAFAELTGLQRRGLNKSITTFFPEIHKEDFPEDEASKFFEILYNDRYFRAEIKRIETEPVLKNSNFFGEQQDNALNMYACILFDETELREYEQRCEDDAMVAGLIYIDNYDEVLESVEEVRRSLLTALIDRKITKYFHALDGVVKKFEKDKYVLIMKSRALSELKEMRFDILEQVKTVNIGNDMDVTISIGIGINRESFSDNFESARIAIDLALGRGGDQAVIKDLENNYYFGGNKEAVEKSTRVKARVKAHALKEFMVAKDKVVIMGHQLIDADGFGAAVGIYRAARTLNKKAHIVIDRVTSSMRPLIDTFKNAPDFDSSMFLNLEQAEEVVNMNTLVVVVDTSKPSYTECPVLLKKTETVVVLDHHRQGQEGIQNAVLSYVEPYASSSCEMVAEILQYFSEDLRIRNIEADALYAGIMVDTDNFMQKTGVRTFEAAAYLRRNGADVTRVRKLFREDMNDYRAKGETIRNAEIYRTDYAISKCPADSVESPTIVASRSANELLNIIGVRASFVLTEYDNRIYVSARAIDEVNVQIIMERMGGGGHLNMAGCQLDNMTVDEAIELLKKTLDEMIAAGELQSAHK